MESKSSFPLIKNISPSELDMFILEILDHIIDRNISRMDLTLVGRFLGPILNIEVICAFVRRK